MRDKIKEKEYFDCSIKFITDYPLASPQRSIDEANHAEGKAGEAYSLVDYSHRETIMRYSRGDAIDQMRDSVAQIIELLELNATTLASVQLEPPVRQMYERLDLAKVYESCTLLAFLVALRFPSKDLRHALDLIGHQGEDLLLDRIAIALGDSSRSIPKTIKFPKIYASLALLFDLPAEQRPAQLITYVKGWYKSMRPIYWHDNHKGAEGAYFGYWCFEGALLAMLLDIDDSALADHPQYPIDLVRHYRNPS